MTDTPPGTTTPVQLVGDVWVKRDDTYTMAGVSGGKVRTCWHLATSLDPHGTAATGLVTAGSRQSPQVNIVAHVARRLGVPCRVHVPWAGGPLTPELASAASAGAEIVQHRPGYNSVIVARARADAAARGWREVPFGMECTEAVRQTAGQVRDLPPGARRLVVPVGSGMSLAGILRGLVDQHLRSLGPAATGVPWLPVLAIAVGADPTKRLDRYAPPRWRDMVQLVQSPQDYHDHAPTTRLGPVPLDPVYEAKCLPYLRRHDLLWCVGIRETFTHKST